MTTTWFGRRPPRTLESEAYLEVQKTADALVRRLSERLKADALSPPLYDVLRILRGAGPEGLSCRALAERMLTRDPDVTRLLDRLVARGLVTRARETRDRRVVRARVTPEGLTLLERLDAPLNALHGEQLGHLGHVRLRTLIQLLGLARERSEESDKT
jgi:DNA-binding MarR family transcriptional regulator